MTLRSGQMALPSRRGHSCGGTTEHVTLAKVSQTRDQSAKCYVCQEPGHWTRNCPGKIGPVRPAQQQKSCSRSGTSGEQSVWQQEVLRVLMSLNQACHLQGHQRLSHLDFRHPGP
ncbi:protein lin-28 homolog A-like [Echinops telfairi]|uniref:Protein lin-28 homolog A-like n=1 Tax=Echinops telfairi TaxID=9371 RepID=A0AC55D8I4_ECHTE|nr:protein lin-28 homolog A-like [Echinops telfairi]